MLARLGASSFLPREELGKPQAKPLQAATFGCAVDTVGGVTLANLVKRLRIGGSVAACGMVGGVELALSVFPFILRGASLLGVDSQHAAIERRRELWSLLAGGWRPSALLDDREAVREIDLNDLEGAIEAMLRGEVSGRVVVRLERAEPST